MRCSLKVQDGACVHQFALPVGIFLPGGFDALWYHLTITHGMLHFQSNVYIPELYQSAMPRLGSFIFAVPFFAAQEFGVKILCYVLALITMLSVFRLALCK
jgi:hypothetical protein